MVGHHHTIRVAVTIVPFAVAGVIVWATVLAVVAIDGSQRRGSEGCAQRVVVGITHIQTVPLIIDSRHLLTHLQEIVDYLIFRVDAEVVA